MTGREQVRIERQTEKTFGGGRVQKNGSILGNKPEATLSEIFSQPRLSCDRRKSGLV